VVMVSLNTRTQQNVTTSNSVCAVIITVQFRSTTIIPVLHVPIRSLLGIEALTQLSPVTLLPIIKQISSSLTPVIY
jgi:hypothetical protein